MTNPSRQIGIFTILRRLAGGGFLNAAGIGFAAYILAICYSSIVAPPDMLATLRSGDITMGELGEGNLQVAIPIVIAALFIFARHGALTVLRYQRVLLVILCIFSSIIVFQSILTGSFPISIAQVTQYLVTVGVFLLSLCFWQAPSADTDDALAMAFIALAGVLIASALIQGFHDYRWVGLIHPNHYARYAYVALVLHSLVMRRVSLLITALAFSAAYMVSARTIMIGILLFCIGHILLAARGISADRHRQLANMNALVLYLFGAALLVVAAFVFVDIDTLLTRLSRDFAVFDAERGVLSGFTGRSSSWNAFFETMPDFVMYGYGFRSSRYELHAVHSGVLSYYMDFGLVLGGGLLVAVIWRAVHLILQGRSSQNQTAFICGLAFTTTLIIQCFEPDNFNIGFIGSFFFILILGYAPRRSSHVLGTLIHAPRLNDFAESGVYRRAFDK